MLTAAQRVLLAGASRRQIKGGAVTFTPCVVKSVLATASGYTVVGINGADVLLIQVDNEFDYLGGRSIAGQDYLLYWGSSVDDNDNIYLCFSSRIVAGGDYFVFVMKVDSSLNIVWQRKISSISSTIAGSLSLYGDFVYITLDNYSPSCTYIFAYSQSGVLQWQRSLFGSSSELRMPRHVHDSSGNLCIFTRDYVSISRPTIVKVSPTGALLDQNRFSMKGYPRAITLDSNNNLYLVGKNDALGGKGFIAKLDSSLSVQWVRELTPPTEDINAVNVIGDQIIISAPVAVSGETQDQTIIAEFDTYGALISQRIIVGEDRFTGLGVLRFDDLSLKLYGNISKAGEPNSMVVIDIDGSSDGLGTYGNGAIEISESSHGWSAVSVNQEAPNISIAASALAESAATMVTAPISSLTTIMLTKD